MTKIYFCKCIWNLINKVWINISSFPAHCIVLHFTEKRERDTIISALQSWNPLVNVSSHFCWVFTSELIVYIVICPYCFKCSTPTLCSNLRKWQDPRYRYPDASTLVVEGVGANDRGLFRCTATNDAGSTSANARVEILGELKYYHYQKINKCGYWFFLWTILIGLINILLCSCPKIHSIIQRMHDNLLQCLLLIK